MLKGKKILILAPHTDDGELGCGGMIAKAIRQSASVYYAAFSTADESVPPQFPANQLETEVKNATRVLGIEHQNLYIYNHSVRKLNYVRQEILEELIILRELIKPDIVLIPSPNDIHQDHSTVAAEGIRAFKNCSVLGYELIWNNLTFKTDLFIALSESDIQIKIKALASYKTQEGKSYMDPDFIRSMARVRGTQVSTTYAEAFEVIRWIDHVVD
ncbi:MAG: PIG-L family deacetylase [Saprospiraceae bacterium]|nr:PIG-L family deacetylase [Saprospiraceae bacterium]